MSIKSSLREMSVWWQEYWQMLSIPSIGSYRIENRNGKYLKKRQQPDRRAGNSRRPPMGF